MWLVILNNTDGLKLALDFGLLVFWSVGAPVSPTSQQPLVLPVGPASDQPLVLSRGR